MTEQPSADEIAATRLAADPGRIRQQLMADLAEMSALGHAEVRADPAGDVPELVAVVRERADRLGFDSPVQTATLAKKRLRELPVAERGPGSAIAAYHRAASRTLRDGHVAAHQKSPDGDRHLLFFRTVEEATGVTVTLEARVRAESDGVVWLDSFGWPTTTASAVYVFTGPEGQYFDQAVADLRDDTVPFDRAMLMLLASTLGTAPSALEDEQRIAAAAGRSPGGAATSAATCTRLATTPMRPSTGTGSERACTARPWRRCSRTSSAAPRSPWST
ncbi:hypothetical protein ABH917_004361 [Thermobifida halotolerans]|uniref:hypothetical protein n=1 Tax=Thermobifida halotolerans TaxID=483545 RepID=UPI0035148D7E